MFRVVFYTGFVVSVLASGLLVLCICAHVVHARYNSTVAFLPCRNDEERACAAAVKWLEFCSARNVTTWITGHTRLASFQQLPNLFPWQYKLEFAYCGDVVYSSPYLVIERHARAPEKLELCVLGFLKNLYRVPKQNPFRVRSVSVAVPRKNTLDLFRLPFQKFDTYYGMIRDDT